MSIDVVEAAIIKKGNAITHLQGGNIRIYRDVTVQKATGEVALYRHLAMSSYVDSQIRIKTAYRLYMVAFRIPVPFYQSGYFFGRNVNCLFGFYDGKQMREDVDNTIKHFRAYRIGSITTASAFLILGFFLAAVSNLFFFVLGVGLIAWFGAVMIFSLMLSPTVIEADMRDAVDVELQRMAPPPPPMPSK